MSLSWRKRNNLLLKKAAESKEVGSGELHPDGAAVRTGLHLCGSVSFAVE